MRRSPIGASARRHSSAKRRPNLREAAGLGVSAPAPVAPFLNLYVYIGAGRRSAFDGATRAEEHVVSDISGAHR